MRPSPPSQQPEPLPDDRASRRHRRRHDRDDALREMNPAQGVVYGLAALVVAGFALYDLEFWWMLFIAFGLAMKSAAILGGRPRASEPSERVAPELERAETSSEAPLERAAPASPEVDQAERAKVDALCGRLRADIDSGPAVAKEIIRDPDRTVESLRKSCHALLERKAQVEALADEGETRRLEGERADLQRRIDAQSDPVTAERLRGALSSLDSQLAQRADLKRIAQRIDAEYTRLYYTLQNLHAQVLRLRSVDLAAEGAQLDVLRRTADQLATEMDAVTEALEAPELQRVAPIAPISASSEADPASLTEKPHERSW